MRKRSLLIPLAIALAAFVRDSTARADEPTIAVVAAGKPTDLLALAKGRPVQVVATVNGQPAAHATWTSVPAGLLDVRDDGNGRATITSLKDMYDDPDRKEPRGRLAVCIESACYSVGAVGLINGSGRWHLHIEVGKGVIARDKDLDFAQDGRRLSYGNVVLRLEGDSLHIVEGGSLLTHVNGSFSDGAHASGTWASTKGLAGTWSVKR